MKVAILGGGIAGLTTARLLHERGIDVTIYEADDVWGGLIQSRIENGFVHDVAGGHILYSRDKPTLDFLLDLLGRDEVVKSERHTRILYRDGSWVPYPFENGLGALPPEDRARCLTGYVEAYAARRARPGPAPGNFHDWILYRMGQGIAEDFMFPYNQKIWKRDLHEISSSWVEGRVPDAPIEDVVRSAMGIPTTGYRHQATFYYPREGGFQAIADRMGEPIRERVRLGRAVRELRRKGSRWVVDGEAYDLAVSTLPLRDLVKIFPDMPGDIREDIDKQQSNGLVTVLLGLDRPEVPELSWVYLPYSEQGPANRITFLSNYSPANAPPGKTSILAEVTVAGTEPPADREGIAREVEEGLERCGILRRAEICHRSVAYCPYAYILYDLCFEERNASILEGLDRMGLWSVGRFARYEYWNSDQVVMAARKLADRIVAAR